MRQSNSNSSVPKRTWPLLFSGIAEDAAGYKGSKDWTRFYSVFYQAEPLMLESHLRSDLKRIGAVTWKVIVVNGSTKSKAKKSRGK